MAVINIYDLTTEPPKNEAKCTEQKSVIVANFNIHFQKWTELYDKQGNRIPE